MPDPNLHDLLAPFGWQQRFEVLERIGAGAMGQVWRAREAATDRIVALKLIDPSHAGDEQTLARLDIEAATLTKLREAGEHEHVVPILDYQITDTHACLVMEFIPGLDLTRWCDSQRLGLRDRVRLMAQVAHAAGWFHGLGVIHRDLKPANILVSALTHQPVIVDFSIAKVAATLSLTLTNEALGTAPYMAPEQFDSRRASVSPATDVYALGATLYELLTQVRPHPGGFSAIVQRHADEVSPAPPSALNPAVPRDLECVLLKALAHRPTDRYPDGSSLADDLERFLDGRPVTARPISRFTHLARQARRKPALTTALAGCFVFALLIVWGYKTVAAERRIQEIEAGITLLTNGTRWSQREFDAVESLLKTLRQEHPARAEACAAKVEADVVQDVEASMLKALQNPDECRWIDDHVVDWLRPRQRELAQTLPKRITDRLMQWRMQTVIRSPFEKLNGLFPLGGMRRDGDLLLPPVPQPGQDVSRVLFTNRRTLPFGISASFNLLEDFVRPLIISLDAQNTSLGVMVCQARHAPASLLDLLEEGALPDPHDFLLTILKNGAWENPRLLKKTLSLGATMKRRSFTLFVRWQERQMEAFLSGQGPNILRELFDAAAPPSGYDCHILWPSGVGLKEVALFTRSKGLENSFSLADQRYSEQHWLSAEALYDRLKDHPVDGAEATFKLALTHWQMGHKDKAIEAWDQLSLSRGKWAESAAFRLWFHAVLEKGPATALPYLSRLPDEAEALPAGAMTMIRREDRMKVLQQHLGLASFTGGAWPDVARAAAALKVVKILGFPNSESAARLALPLHYCGLDLAARERLSAVFTGGTAILASPAAGAVLDHWCRIHWSERNPELAGLLAHSTAGPRARLVAEQERCRAFARAGQWQEALQRLLQAQSRLPDDSAHSITSALLEGALQQAQGNEKAAAEAWRRGIEQARGRDIQDHGILTDLFILRIAGKAWNRDAVAQTLIPLLGLADDTDLSVNEIALHAKQLLFSAESIRAFNTLAGTEEIRELILQSAFRLCSARELVQRWYGGILAHGLLVSAFDPPTEREAGRVRALAEQLVAETLMDSRADKTFFPVFFRAWNDPAAARRLVERPPSVSPSLVENLKWLLTQRHPQTAGTNTGQAE